MKKATKVLLTGILTMMLVLGFGFSAEAAHPSRLVDDADILSSSEEMNLLDTLNELSNELQFDIVVVTTDSTEGKSMRDCADDFFDYNGYGMGDHFDGALLLVDMTQREWYISTSGYGRKALNDSELDYIGEEVANHLSWEEYTEAFDDFAEMVADEVEDARDGDHLSVGEIVLRVIISILVGGALAFIPVANMKKKLNNVERKNKGSDYVRRDRIVITEQRDLFLYQHVQRTLKPKDSGSSTHRSSSGRSHGGRGGGF